MIWWCGLFAAARLFAAVGANPDGSYYVDSPDLVVTVFPTTGLIRVQDRANSAWTWNKRTSTAHTAFSNVTLFSPQNCIGFNTTFYPASGGTSPGQLFTWTELWLDGRKLKMKVNIDNHSTTLGLFNFLEPFQPSSSMSFVVPDFNDGHIYPCNLISWPWYNLDSLKVMNLTMPWVGVLDPATGQGYAVIVDNPYDAQLKLTRYNGLRSPLIAWNPEKGQFGYTRSLTYYFTATDGYVGLAKAYRERAQADGLLVTLTEKSQTRTNITKLYGAPFLWDFSANLPMQTLRTIGVAKAFQHVERWDGGGATDAKRNTANALGFLTEEYDYYSAGPVDGGSQTYQNYHISTNQCARESTGDVLYVGTWGARCSEFFLPVGQGIIPQRLSNDPQSGRYIDQMTQNMDGHDTGPRGGGGAAWECFSTVHPKTRTQWVADVVNFYRYLAQDLKLITGAELGKFYQVPYTEMFHGIGSWFWPWPDVTFPAARGTNTSDWTTYDDWAINPACRVPLWQLVFHDCSIGSWYPWDGNDICHRFDGHYQDQKDAMSVLCGIPAMFMVTGTSSSGSGSQYFNTAPGQRQRWLQSYRNACKIHEAIADKEMTAHKFLTTDRLTQQTEWSDGTKIIANFSTNEFWADVGFQYASLLKQYCFVAKGPWGGAIRSYYYDPARIVTYLWNDGYHFDDEQLSSGQPVALAMAQTATNALRVNVDEIPGQANVTFRISPTLLQASWDFPSTHVYLCRATDGVRLQELSWTRPTSTSIQVSGVSGWIVLDVVSAPPAPPWLNIEFQSGPSTGVDLSLNGTVGRHYRVEYTNSTTANSPWQTLTNILSLPASPYTFHDASPLDSTQQRYYRAVDVQF